MQQQYSRKEYEEAASFIAKIVHMRMDDVSDEQLMEILHNEDLFAHALTQVFHTMLTGHLDTHVFTHNMNTIGWKLLENCSYTEGTPASDLELVSFVGKDEEYVLGGDMLTRSKRLNAELGQKHAEYLLLRQNEIPEEWRQYQIIFSGTIWRARTGDRQVPYLCWGNGVWSMKFYWFAYDFHPLDRLARLSKEKK